MTTLKETSDSTSLCPRADGSGTAKCLHHLGRALPRLTRLFASLGNSNWVTRRNGVLASHEGLSTTSSPCPLTPWTNIPGLQSPECSIPQESCLPSPQILSIVQAQAWLEQRVPGQPLGSTISSGNPRSMDHSSRPKAQTGRGKECRGGGVGGDCMVVISGSRLERGTRAVPSGGESQLAVRPCSTSGWL